MIAKLYTHFLAHPVVTTDSRNCPEGSIFFALKGERFDGNKFAAEVLGKGCSLAVVDDASVIPAGDSRYFLVPDVLTALQQLAAYHRQQFKTWEKPVSVIGITGTNGKTTTKELLNAVLSQKYNVLATAGNLNNQIGVPLTLLKVTQQHEIAIVEMGANHPMDIADLCEISRPDFGLITNVGKAHLLGFGSLEGVVEAKTKLYDSLRLTGGKVFVDAGNPYLLPKAEGLDRIMYSDADICKDGVVMGRFLSCSPYLSMELTFADTAITLDTHLIGNYNLINIVAAATVGNTFGVTPAQVKTAIEGYMPKNMRSQLIDLEMGRQIILDAYNANPTSMMAALQSFNRNTAQHKSLVLGDMGELGEESAREHLNIMHYLMQEEVTFGDILLVGKEFCKAFDSLTDDEVMQLSKHRSVHCYADITALTTPDVTGNMALTSLPGTILIKGSRSMQLEKALKAFGIQ